MSNLTCEHLKIKCGNDYNGFNMNREHMPFHGLTNMLGITSLKKYCLLGNITQLYRQKSSLLNHTFLMELKG